MVNENTLKLYLAKPKKIVTTPPMSRNFPKLLCHESTGVPKYLFSHVMASGFSVTDLHPETSNVPPSLTIKPVTSHHHA